MRNIEERWGAFQSRSIPHDAPAIQRRVMHIAFFAGATAMLDATTEASEHDLLVAVIALELLRFECLSFATQP